MGSKTNFLENSVLDHNLAVSAFTSPTTVYSALFTVIPSDSTPGTEVTTTEDANYTRIASTFSTAGLTVTGQSVNSGAVNFTTVSAGATLSIVGWALYDNATAGDQFYWATVATTTLEDGDQATFPAGNITITED